MNLGRRLHHGFDWMLLLIVSAIATLGVLNLYSATEGGIKSDAYVQQVYWILLGFSVAALVSLIDYKHYERFGWMIYAGGVLLLVLVFLLGANVRGSVRWISFGSLSLQPSELVKISLIIAIAKYLHNDPRSGGRRLGDLIVPSLMLALPMGLILLQPDLGTALLCSFIFASMIILPGIRVQSLLTLVVSFAVTAPLAWTYMLHPYQRGRVVAFWERLSGLNPDLLGTGWHTHQSLIAIGSGGMFGKGFMHGTQTRFRFLPDQHTDFPFPVWAEEQGFVGAALLILLYIALVLWSLRIASQARDRFGAAVAVGVGALIFWQAAVNLGMVCGVLPVVGMTLPLFSYGGSSLLSTMLGLGLLMNISMRRYYR